MRIITFLLIFAFCTACGPQTDAINWYLRIEHTDKCEDYALFGGKYEILCPIDEAVWNGDSLVVKSKDVCYFIKLKEYEDGQKPKTIPCVDFTDFVKAGPHIWGR